MKDFIYLGQGQSGRVANYRHLAARKQADALFLTYDTPLEGEGALFLPRSTWAEGRNRLLEVARQRGAYRYYIFCDDDIAFVRGGWDEFEAQLLAFEPAIGVPVVPRTLKYTLAWLEHQAFLINDEQLMAFHHEVVADALVLPYQRQFDAIHWWIACEIQQALVQRFYPRGAVQFNRVEIANECRARYSTPERIAPRAYAYRWLREQFAHGRRLQKNRPGSARVKVAALKEYARFLCRGGYPARYRVSETAVKAGLCADSPLLAQYLARRGAVV